MLNRMKGILENIVVFEDQMMANIYRTNGVIFAQTRNERPYRQRIRA